MGQTGYYPNRYWKTFINFKNIFNYNNFGESCHFSLIFNIFLINRIFYKKEIFFFFIENSYILFLIIHNKMYLFKPLNPLSWINKPGIQEKLVNWAFCGKPASKPGRSKYMFLYIRSLKTYCLNPEKWELGFITLTLCLVWKQTEV